MWDIRISILQSNTKKPLKWNVYLIILICYYLLKTTWTALKKDLKLNKITKFYHDNLVKTHIGHLSHLFMSVQVSQGL